MLLSALIGSSPSKFTGGTVLKVKVDEMKKVKNPQKIEKKSELENLVDEKSRKTKIERDANKKQHAARHERSHAQRAPRFVYQEGEEFIAEK